MKKLLPIALVVLALVGCSSAPGSSLSHASLVEFKVYSVSKTRTVETIALSAAGTKFDTSMKEVRLPYSEEVLAPSKVIFGKADSLNLTVGTGQDGGHFVCEIYVNNKLVDKQEVEGVRESVTCSGLAPSS